MEKPKFTPKEEVEARKFLEDRMAERDARRQSRIVNPKKGGSLLSGWNFKHR